MSNKPCNRCQVEDLKREAKLSGAAVYITPRPIEGFPSGTDVFVVPVGQKLNIKTSRKTSKQWKMWAASVSKECVC